MFGKAVESIGQDRHGGSVLQEGVSIIGEVDAVGDLRVEGKLEGKIRVSERLVVGGQGTLVAEIEAGEAVIHGCVTGKIKVAKRLELRKGARVIGDLTSPALVIEDGVHFQGRVNMDPGRDGTPDLLPPLSGSEMAEPEAPEPQSSYPGSYR